MVICFNLYAAAADLFDELDDLARTFGEISSIAKRGTRLTGAAKDPVTVRLALEDFLPPDHFARTGGAALVLGSGGTGCALSHQLGVRVDRPSEIICTERSDDRLDHLRDLHARTGIAGVRYVRVEGPADTDALLAALPPSSLVANATGMGKDVPGSPLSRRATFPQHAVVWEFNYRGSLEFLQQAGPNSAPASCSSRTAGATSCTVGARSSPMSSPSRCPARRCRSSPTSPQTSEPNST